MNLFDILGPVMVGPSSSHTAGAVRIGRMARALLGQEPVRAQLLPTAPLPPPERATAPTRPWWPGCWASPGRRPGPRQLPSGPGAGAVLLLRHLRPAGRPPQQRPHPS